VAFNPGPVHLVRSGPSLSVAASDITAPLACSSGAFMQKDQASEQCSAAEGGPGVTKEP
jgi:hypothetical protein